jgi:hypothetical protein
MYRHIIPSLGVALMLLASAASAQSLPPEEQAFIDKHLGSIVNISTVRLTQPVVTQVFSAPLYLIEVTVNSGDGGSTGGHTIAARVDDKLVAVSRPGTDSDFPLLLKMLGGDFRLVSDSDAQRLQDALDIMFPVFDRSDKESVAFRRAGNQWTFVRGTFFDDKMGFVFTTDPQGKVTAVKYRLRLP